MAFNGDAVRELAAQFLALAEKQGATVPLMIGHRIMGTSLLYTGDIAEGRAHLDRAIALYDPAEHRPLATRFGQDVRVAILSYRSWALWMLGYPEAALADADHALEDAREIGQAATLMYALRSRVVDPYPTAGITRQQMREADELVALADEKGTSFWKALGMLGARLRIGLHRQARGCGSHDHLRDHSIAVNGINLVDAIAPVISGEGLCRAWPAR